MREIKFRAWDIEGKKVCPVDNLHLNGSPLGLVFCVRELGSEETPFSYLRKGVCLMQFTGLQDKNGKEIYENDIVLHHVKGDDEKYQYVIVWNQSGFSLVKSLGDIPTSFILDKSWGNSLEVSGNIYENSDLLAPAQKEHPDYGKDCAECGGWERNHKANCAAVE